MKGLKKNRGIQCFLVLRSCKPSVSLIGTEIQLNSGRSTRGLLCPFLEHIESLYLYLDLSVRTNHVEAVDGFLVVPWDYTTNVNRIFILYHIYIYIYSITSTSILDWWFTCKIWHLYRFSHLNNVFLDFGLPFAGFVIPYILCCTFNSSVDIFCNSSMFNIMLLQLQLNTTKFRHIICFYVVSSISHQRNDQRTAISKLISC